MQDGRGGGAQRCLPVAVPGCVSGGMSRGLFLVLEGTEGAGKSTQVGLMLDWFTELGIDHRTAREPGGTPVGEAIRHVLLEMREMEVPAETELFLMLGARAAFVRGLVEPVTAAGTLFLADRFDYSTFAYQGHGRGLDLAQVRQVNRVATGGLVPDLYLVLDLPAEEGVARQQAEGKEPDRIERAGSDFLSRVRDGYRSLVQDDPGAELIDARGTPADVQDRIREVLRRRFPETFVKQGFQG